MLVDMLMGWTFLNKTGSALAANLRLTCSLGPSPSSSPSSLHKTLRLSLKYIPFFCLIAILSRSFSVVVSYYQ